RGGNRFGIQGVGAVKAARLREGADPLCCGVGIGLVGHRRPLGDSVITHVPIRACPDEGDPALATAVPVRSNHLSTVMPALVARVSGTVCAYHAASLIVTDARASRRRCAARVAYGPKSKLGCCGSGVSGGLSSSAIGRRCMRLARM